MLGTGIDLSVYLSVIYKQNEALANIYFFNNSGEITGALDGSLVDKKISVDDELRIKQIMNNILSNAFKYTASGTVKLSISTKAEEKPGEGSTFTVTLP